MMMSVTWSFESAYSMAAASEPSFHDLPSPPAGGTRLPTFRTTNRSPGSAEAKRLGTTRLSEQAMNRVSGACPSAKRANLSR